VLPEIRFLVDKYTDLDEVSEGHRIMFFDIEVEVTQGFPDVNKAENTITSIALYDELTKQYYCYVLDKENKVDTKLFNKCTVIKFKSETELLRAFYTKYLEISPTIISGWNSDRFDVPYLYNRSRLLLGDEVANCLSPIGIVEFQKYKGTYKIAGVASLDYLELYKKLTFGERSSYRLDDIGKLEVDINKVSYEGTLNDLYDGDRNRFVKYNINDVVILEKLDAKLDFIGIARAICHLGHVPYEDVYYSSRFLEGAILVYLKKVGIVAPNKVKANKHLMSSDDKFAGAYVQDPQKGKHEWVYDLDITSMYPSIIMSLNISPETKLGKLDSWEAESFIKGVDKTYSIKDKNGKESAKLTTAEFKNFLKDNNVSISTNGVLYTQDRKGLIPTLLEKWFDDRVQFRKLAKKFADSGDKEKYAYFDRRQYIQKVVLNSLYGVLGLPVFRFYDIDNAEATTTTGVELIKYTRSMVNHYYNSVVEDKEDYCIYIDTDSVFYSAVPIIEKKYPHINVKDENLMTSKILEIASSVQNYLNNSYDLFAKKFCNINEHRFEIKQELIAKSGLFVTKKRYGMKVINDNGVRVNKLHVKGLDIVRSSFPAAFKECLTKVLEDILADVPMLKINEFILNFKKSMRLKKYDTIAMPTSVKNVKKYISMGEGILIAKKGAPVHVKSAINYNNFLLINKLNKKYPPVGNGEKIKWTYLKDNPLKFDTICYKGHEDPKQVLDYITQYIDTDKIYKQALSKKVKMLYQALQWEEPNDDFGFNKFF
jgi:DNA polymerase elongation subunit (family B)